MRNPSMLPHGHQDWQRPDDYDPEDAHWVDVTRIGSAYQEEMDLSREGHYRHRNVMSFGAWQKGRPDEY
ncbi:hypothetical protein RPALISO_178 [Ruegeria phage RpAliso]|nr:hypothetical protein RPALISO_178 [Ruegeria phage RpAliso]